MTYKELADACIELWNQMKYREAYERYYSEGAVKVEPVAWDVHTHEVSGQDAIADHEEWLWEEWVEPHSITIAEGPFIGANGFAVIIESDFTIRDTGERHVFREVGVFTVENDKIVREEYIYEEKELAEAVRLNAAAQANKGA